MAPVPHLFVATIDQLTTAIDLDDDASMLFADHGLDVHLPAEHPFVRAEQAFWTDALAAGRLWFAADPADPLAPLGFAAYGFLDGEPYLDQLAVRRSAMRRGLGRALITHTAAWAAGHGDALWLTTYAHLPFNGPYYASLGFTLVSPPHRPELAATLAEQRACLPAPEQRIAMRLPLRTGERRR